MWLIICNTFAVQNPEFQYMTMKNLRLCCYDFIKEKRERQKCVRNLGRASGVDRGGLMPSCCTGNATVPVERQTIRAVLYCEIRVVNFLCQQQATFNLQTIQNRISNSSLYGRVMTNMDGREAWPVCFGSAKTWPELTQSQSIPVHPNPILSMSASLSGTGSSLHRNNAKALETLSRRTTVQLTGHDHVFNTFCCQPCIALVLKSRNRSKSYE